jgi:hypothetical protein
MRRSPSDESIHRQRDDPQVMSPSTGNETITRVMSPFTGNETITRVVRPFTDDETIREW